jgi:hypothetical protein
MSCGIGTTLGSERLTLMKCAAELKAVFKDSRVGKWGRIRELVQAWESEAKRAGGGA